MIVESFFGTDKTLQEIMFELRENAFVDFSPDEEMINWRFDSFCTHKIVFNNGNPLGCVSVADYLNHPEIHNYFGLDKMIKNYSPTLRIKGIHRLVSKGNHAALKKLLISAFDEAKQNADFIFGYTAPPIDNYIDNLRSERLMKRYCSLSGMEPIGIRTHNGVTQYFFGKQINAN